MAWYSDRGKLSHTQTYADRAAATKDRQKAAEYGWQVEAETSPQGPASDPIWAQGGAMARFWREIISLARSW